ncbi:MAG TPA: sulfatase-like hydrolase/transferase [bacterium]|nr:sulfatase-like hydrolase/transferase [bacterium]
MRDLQKCNRREFISCAFAFMLTPLLQSVVRSEKKGVRPNILWLTLEDVCPDLGCYGDPVAQTPCLDRFSREAVRYTHCFSVSGVCAPSLACLATGMYSNSIGTHHMRTRTKDFPWLPKPYEAVPPPQVKHFAEYLRLAGYYCSNDEKTDYQFGNPISVWDDCRAGAHWRNRREGQPFFAVINHIITHESQIRLPLEKKAVTDPASIVLPPYYPDTAVVRNDYARYYDNIASADAQIGRRLQELDEDGLADSTIVFIFGDNGRGLPRGKRWLYDSGLRVPLLIRWPGHLQPGSATDRLVSFVDFAPTVLSVAGVPVPKHMQGKAFLGEQAKSARQFIFAARDRMDETYDCIRAARDKRFKYLANLQPEKPYAQKISYMDEMPSMKEWRQWHAQGRLTGAQALFFSERKPEEELYDTEKDPHEVNNLAQDPAHRADLLRLRRACQRWRKEIHDLADTPEPKMIAAMWPGGIQPQTEAPTLRPAAGRFVKPVQVRLTCATRGASIVYTTELGANPHWQLYGAPVKLTTSATLRCKAIRYGYKESAEVQGEYVLQPR